MSLILAAVLVHRMPLVPDEMGGAAVLPSGSEAASPGASAPAMAHIANRPAGPWPVHPVSFVNGPRTILLPIAWRGQGTCNGPDTASSTHGHVVCFGQLMVVEDGDPTRRPMTRPNLSRQRWGCAACDTHRDPTRILADEYD